MRKLFAVAALVSCALAGQAQNFAHFPALTPWQIRWDDANTVTPLSFDLFYGANKVATLDASNYTLEGVTNNVATYRASVPAVLLGTNIVTMVATDGTNRSAPSLPLTVLGEFLPPRNLRP